MRICFIGNSHLGPLAKANLTLQKEIADYSAGHYIARTYGEVPLKLIGRRDVISFKSILLEDKPNVRTVVNVDEWDYIMVVGLGFSLIRLIEKWKDYQPDTVSNGIGDHLLTPSLSETYEDHIMEQSQALQVIHELRKLTDKPIGLVPAPLPAEWASRESGERLSHFHKFNTPIASDYALSAYQRQLERVVGQGVRIFAQPPETVIGKIWTKTEFCLGQPDDEDPKGFFSRRDFYHMNKEYGAQVMGNIISTLV